MSLERGISARYVAEKCKYSVHGAGNLADRIRNLGYFDEPLNPTAAAYSIVQTIALANCSRPVKSGSVSRLSCIRSESALGQLRITNRIMT